MAQELFSGVVKGGTFKADDPVRFAGRMARLEGRRVRAAFRRESAGRTLSQNRYYWGVVLATLSEWSGHDPEELHDYFKGFLKTQPRELPGGATLDVHPSTTSLTVEEFSAHVDKVVRWAAEQGVNVPDASEVAE
jgi:hypothetical protein